MSTKCDLCRIQGLSPPKAEHKCVNCNFYFCSKCKNSHVTNENTRNHAFLSEKEFSESLKNSQDDNCSIHKKEKELFCAKCHQLICISCKFEVHDGHDTNFVKDMIKDAKRNLIEYLNTMETQKDNIQSNINDLKNKRFAINESFDKAYNAMNTRKIEIMKLIEEWFEESLEKFNSFRTEVNERIGVDENENSLKFLVENSTIAKEVLKNGSEASILKVWNDLKNYKNALGKKPASDIRIVCNFKTGSNSNLIEKNVFGELILQRVEEVEIQQENQPALNEINEPGIQSSKKGKNDVIDTTNTKTDSSKAENLNAIYPLNTINTFEVRTTENKPGLFRSIIGVAPCESIASINDMVYVADPYSRSIYKFDNSGSIVGTIKLEFAPKCIGTMKNGDLILSSSSSVFIYSEDKSLRESNVSFKESFGVLEINENEIAVSDRGEGHIFVLNSKTLEVTRRIKGGGGWPSYLAIDQSSYIYAVFTGWATDCLRVFDSQTGKKIKEYTSKTDVDFGEIKGICIDANRNILLCDSEKQSILICYDYNGVWEVLETKEIYDLDKPVDFTLRKPDELWVLDSNKLKVYEYGGDNDATN